MPDEHFPDSLSRDGLESRWKGCIARLLLGARHRKGALHPRSAGSWDHRMDPIRTFQTVSPRTWVNKPSEFGAPEGSFTRLTPSATSTSCGRLGRALLTDLRSLPPLPAPFRRYGFPQ